MRDELHVGAAETRALTATLVRGGEGELEARMSRNQRTQLAARIPARAEDSNRDSMHTECILLQSVDVNRLPRQRCHLTVRLWTS